MRRRATLAAALAATLLLATTGCTFVAEIATLEEYDPSDGVGTTVGEVQVRNMLAITDDGERASLVFSASNNSDRTVRLNISLTEGGEPQQVALPAGVLTSVGSEGEQLVLDGLDVIPGELLPVYVQYGEEPGRLLDVPVLDAALPEYAALAPSPEPVAPPTPAPTETAVPADPDAQPTPGPEETPGSTPEEGEGVDG